MTTPTTRPGRRPLDALDLPRDSQRRGLPVSVRTPTLNQERFGVWSERFARFMGTAKFLMGMSVFVVVWLAWNTFAPTTLQLSLIHISEPTRPY